jgi:predicted phosphodiesterase
MYGYKRLFKIFETAEQILFDDSSKIILMSDCHRGDGTWADDFSRNQNIYFAALTYYFNEDYTYIELGDGDELWENNSISDIILQHSDAYWLMSKFIKANRFYSLFGNHDMVKKNNGTKINRGSNKFDERIREYISLVENIKHHEGLILKHSVTDRKIFLVHGHQVDYLNDRLWRLARFLVRKLWRPLEVFGVNDPTSAAKNYERKAAVEKKLAKWAKDQNQVMIAGHTHRPVFPAVGDTPYFNDGSCVHPRCITGIEISDGSIALVKWSIKPKDDGKLAVGRDILAGPVKLEDYFNAGGLSNEDLALVGLLLYITSQR